MGFVQVRGAKEHNLKNINVDIPRNKLVVFTGISGSGKSSLAFGTIYAEAQRRYLESVSPYARRLFNQMPVPNVDAIHGLPPAVACNKAGVVQPFGLQWEVLPPFPTYYACYTPGRVIIPETSRSYMPKNSHPTRLKARVHSVMASDVFMMLPKNQWFPMTA